MTAVQASAVLCAAAGVALAVWLIAPQPRRLLARLGSRHGAAARAAADEVSDAALVAELIAATLAGGLPVPTALRAVATAVATDVAAGPGRPGKGPMVDALEVLAGAAATAQPFRPAAGPLAPVADAVAFAAATGAPVVPLLTHAAAAVRRHRRDAAVRAAGRLAASLVMPLGLCALPGFLLLGVAPVVVRLVLSLG